MGFFDGLSEGELVDTNTAIAGEGGRYRVRRGKERKLRGGRREKQRKKRGGRRGEGEGCEGISISAVICIDNYTHESQTCV